MRRRPGCTVMAMSVERRGRGLEGIGRVVRALGARQGGMIPGACGRRATRENTDGRSREIVRRAPPMDCGRARCALNRPERDTQPASRAEGVACCSQRANSRGGKGTADALHDLAALEHREGRDAADAVARGKFGVGVGVDFREHDVGALRRFRREHRGEGAAWTAPARPEVDDHRPRAAGHLVEVSGVERHRRPGQQFLRAPAADRRLGQALGGDAVSRRTVRTGDQHGDLGKGIVAAYFGVLRVGDKATFSGRAARHNRPGSHCPRIDPGARG